MCVCVYFTNFGQNIYGANKKLTFQNNFYIIDVPLDHDLSAFMMSIERGRLSFVRKITHNTSTTTIWLSNVRNVLMRPEYIIAIKISCKW